MQEDLDCVRRKIIQIDQLFQEYLKKCNKLKNLVKTSNLLSQDRERLVLENNHQKFTLETLQKSYDELGIKHQDMTAQFSNLEQKYNQTLTDSQSHTRDLEDELRMLRELNTASKSPSPKKSNPTNIDKNIIKNSDDELTDCKLKTKQKKNAYSKEIAQLKVQLKDLNELVSTLRAEKEEFLHEIPKLRSQIKISKQSCRDKDNEIKALTLNVLDCKNHIKNLEKTNEELQNLINKHQAVIRLKSRTSISTQTDDGPLNPNPDEDLDEKVKSILREMLDHPPVLTPLRTDSPENVPNIEDTITDKSIQIEETCDIIKSIPLPSVRKKIIKEEQYNEEPITDKWIQIEETCDNNESLPLPPIQKNIIKKKRLKRRILRPKRRDTLLEALKILQKSKINFSICDSNSKTHIEQTNCDRIGGKPSTLPKDSNRETMKNNVLDKITDLVFEKLNRNTRSNSPFASQFETNKDVIAANALLMKKIRDSAMLGNKFWSGSDVSSIISSPTCPNQLSQASSVTETMSQHNEFILNQPFSPSSVNSTECTEDHFHENTSQDVKKFNKNPNINILQVDIIQRSVKQNGAKKESKKLNCDNTKTVSNDPFAEVSSKKDNLFDSSITFESDNSYINNMLHSDSSKNTNIVTNVEEVSLSENLLEKCSENEALQSSSEYISEGNLLGYDTKQNKWVSEIKRSCKQKSSSDTLTDKCINLDQSPSRKKTCSSKKNQAEDNKESSNSGASKFKKRKPKVYVSKLKSQIIRQMRAKQRMFQMQPPSISSGCDDSFLDKQTSLSNRKIELNSIEDAPEDGELQEDNLVRIEPTDSQEPGTEQEQNNDEGSVTRRTRSNSSFDVLSQIMGEMDKTLPPVYCSIAKSVKENSRSTKRRIAMPEFKPYKKGISKRKSAKKRKKCRNKKARLKLTESKEEPV